MSKLTVILSKRLIVKQMSWPHLLHLLHRYNVISTSDHHVTLEYDGLFGKKTKVLLDEPEPAIKPA